MSRHSLEDSHGSRGAREQEVEEKIKGSRETSPNQAVEEDVNQQDASATQGPKMNRVVWIIFIASIVSSPFLFGFDLVVVGNVQPQIVEELGEINKLPWISVAYALAAMATTLFWGRLFGMFNIKFVFIAAVLIFDVGVALSGAAPTMNTLIAARALSGLGSVGTYAGAMNILAVVTTTRQRPLYISFITLAYGSSTVLAPIVGGAFADSSASWRWSFYINLCISGLFAPGYLLLFPSKTIHPSKSIKECVFRLDPVGNILWAGTTASCLMAISFGGAIYTWDSPRIIGLFVCSGVLLMGFVFQQRLKLATSADARMFPVIFMHSREMWILFCQVATSTAVATVPIFLIPLYFEFARGSSAIGAGLHLLPLMTFRSVGILLNGFLMRRFGYVMPWYLAGAALCVAGSVPLTLVDSKTSAADIYGFSILLGAGVGLYNQASFAVAQARVEPRLAPQAIAFITCGQVVGSAISLAVANSIFINQVTDLIGKQVSEASRERVQQMILEGSQVGVLHDSTTSQQAGIVQAISASLNHSYASVVAASTVSLILAALMKRDKLFKQRD
ncbi:MAG: hypothetical protein M1831_001667 [Alyxoria varia]|nr:MAG: hypothetical protein M1831_001667 [Alyxoria varia]